jgi:hypothetical protein
VNPTVQIYGTIVDFYSQPLSFPIGASLQRVLNFFTQVFGVDFLGCYGNLIDYANDAAQPQNSAFGIVAFPPKIDVPLESHPAFRNRGLDALVGNESIPLENMADCSRYVSIGPSKNSGGSDFDVVSDIQNPGDAMSGILRGLFLRISVDCACQGNNSLQDFHSNLGPGDP